MKSILITGGTGFIGSCLAERALCDGYKVTVVDSLDSFYDKSIKIKNIEKVLRNSNYIFLEKNISDTQAILQDIKSNVDVIVHLAAKAGAHFSVLNPFDYTETNVKGTIKVCELARELNVEKLIFSSSSSVYGNNPQTPWTEDFALMPQSPYAKTKVLSERFLKDFSTQCCIDVLVFRLFNVYGPKMRPDLMMSKMIKCIFTGESLKIYGNGKSSRDYIYVDDVVESIMRGIETEIRQYTVLNVGSGIPISLNKLINIFENITGKKLLCEFIEKNIDGPFITCADSSKMQRVLNYRPSTEIEEGVKTFIEWYEANQS